MDFDNPKVYSDTFISDGLVKAESTFAANKNNYTFAANKNVDIDGTGKH